VADIDGGEIDETCHILVDELGAGRHLDCRVDVSQEPDVSKLFHFVLSRLGRVDILVCSAGILRTSGVPRPASDLSLDEWDRVIDVNLTGTFLCNREAVRIMIRQRRGQIINMSSMSGLRGHALDSAYCASKFGVIGLSESIAEEVRRFGIRVQTVLPDVVATPLWAQNGLLPAPYDSLPAERVADFITFLATLPEDSILINPVLGRFGGSRRRQLTPEAP
jgi:NAD(P)-dependent dehydrogenase (short-subunit alcohol dehydrogenase family)